MKPGYYFSPFHYDSLYIVLPNKKGVEVYADVFLIKSGKFVTKWIVYDYIDFIKHDFEETDVYLGPL